MQTAIGLLSTGQPARARDLLEPLPDQIVEELGMAWARGHAAAVARPCPRSERPRKAARPVRPGKPAFQRQAAELLEHVGRLGPARVAELLGVRMADLGPLLEGRVEVAKAALERVRQAEG